MVFISYSSSSDTGSHPAHFSAKLPNDAHCGGDRERDKGAGDPQPGVRISWLILERERNEISVDSSLASFGCYRDSWARKRAMARTSIHNKWE